MEKIKQELYGVYVKYKDFDFMNHYYKVSNTNTNNKYSKGIGFTAGLYEPSYVDEMRCGNATIGKEIKNIDKGYDYKCIHKRFPYFKFNQASFIIKT